MSLDPAQGGSLSPTPSRRRPGSHNSPTLPMSWNTRRFTYQHHNMGSQFDDQARLDLRRPLCSWQYDYDLALVKNTRATEPRPRLVRDDCSFVSNSGTGSRTSSDSDVHSLDDITAFDFPEPPPIGTPTIRRMRSSPWFVTEDESGRTLSGQDWRPKVNEDRLKECRRYSCSPDFEIKTSVPGIRAIRSDMIRTGDARMGAARYLLEGRPEERRALLDVEADRHSTNTFASHASAPSLVPWSISRTLVSSNLSGRKTLESPPQSVIQESHSFSPLPRIIRKVTSMKSDMQKVPVFNQHHPPGNVTGRTITKARSFRSILRLSELKGGGTEGGTDVLPNIRPLTNSSRKPNGDKGRMSAYAPDTGPCFDAKKRQIWGQHLSFPLTGLETPCEDQDLPDVLDGAARGLARPFSHRPTDKNTSKKTTSLQQQNTSKSFIDLTPDRDVKLKGGARRERVMNLIAKAGNGIFGWRKGRTKGVSVS